MIAGGLPLLLSLWREGKAAVVAVIFVVAVASPEGVPGWVRGRLVEVYEEGQVVGASTYMKTPVQAVLRGRQAHRRLGLAFRLAGNASNPADLFLRTVEQGHRRWNP